MSQNYFSSKNQKLIAEEKNLLQEMLKGDHLIRDLLAKSFAEQIKFTRFPSGKINSIRHTMTAIKSLREKKARSKLTTFLAKIYETSQQNRRGGILIHSVFSFSINFILKQEEEFISSLRMFGDFSESFINYSKAPKNNYKGRTVEPLSKNEAKKLIRMMEEGDDSYRDTFVKGLSQKLAVTNIARTKLYLLRDEIGNIEALNARSLGKIITLKSSLHNLSCSQPNGGPLLEEIYNILLDICIENIDTEYLDSYLEMVNEFTISLIAYFSGKQEEGRNRRYQ